MSDESSKNSDKEEEENEEEDESEEGSDNEEEESNDEEKENKKEEEKSNNEEDNSNNEESENSDEESENNNKKKSKNENNKKNEHIASEDSSEFAKKLKKTGNSHEVESNIDKNSESAIKLSEEQSQKSKKNKNKKNKEIEEDDVMLSFNSSKANSQTDNSKQKQKKEKSENENSIISNKKKENENEKINDKNSNNTQSKNSKKYRLKKDTNKNETQSNKKFCNNDINSPLLATDSDQTELIMREFNLNAQPNKKLKINIEPKIIPSKNNFNNNQIYESQKPIKTKKSFIQQNANSIYIPNNNFNNNKYFGNQTYNASYQNYSNAFDKTKPNFTKYSQYTPNRENYYYKKDNDDQTFLINKLQKKIDFLENKTNRLESMNEVFFDLFKKQNKVNNINIDDYNNNFSNNYNLNNNNNILSEQETPSRKMRKSKSQIDMFSVKDLKYYRKPIKIMQDQLKAYIFQTTLDRRRQEFLLNEQINDLKSEVRNRLLKLENQNRLQMNSLAYCMSKDNYDNSYFNRLTNQMYNNQKEIEYLKQTYDNQLNNILYK